MAQKVDEKYTNRLYFRITLLIFGTFIAIVLMTLLILLLFLLTPLSKFLILGFTSMTLVILISTFSACLILGSFLCYVLIKKILSPIVDLSNKSILVAQGDFNIKVLEESSLPELQELLHNFNIMVNELSKVETLSSDFVSNVSHEFKTPLAIIRSNVNILQNTSLTDEEKEACLKKIDASTEKLSSLISNVLKLSKLDNQTITLINKPFRLDEQLRKCLLNQTIRLEEKNIELDLDLDECYIDADEEFLAPVWDNLISNAIKFSPNNGVIGIDLKTLENNDIQVMIWDHGIGMTEETQRHIFDRFYQGETSHIKEGNGLGMTIVSKILKVYNATISIESKLSKGTKFIITFKNDKKTQKFK